MRPARALVVAVAALAASGCAVVTREEMDKRLQEVRGGSVPAGTVVAFAGDQVPSGWLLCDGAEYEIARFPALASAIGHAYGTSDAATRFRVPDYRGRFLRGVDRGAGRDPDAARRAPMGPLGNSGDQVGTAQEDAFASHQHDIQRSPGSDAMGVGNFQAGKEESIRGIVRTSPAGGSETRPVNASVHWIIRAL